MNVSPAKVGQTLRRKLLVDFGAWVSMLFFFVQSALAADQGKPPLPAHTITALEKSNVAVFCVGCDEKFGNGAHKEVLQGLAANPYVAELRNALYQQDILHQFESKAHFDNCDFDSATAYITSLLDEAGGHVGKAQKAQDSEDKAGIEVSAAKAFFTIGQALHAVQDFYAHSNYVEMAVPKVKKVADIEVIAPWRQKGRDRIQELRGLSLYSGFVFWGFPQKCPAGTLTHGDVAKDSATTKSGAKLVPLLQNLSQYKVAFFLAREASLQLMTDAFKQWPLLKELNGEKVAFEILVDRRGVDSKPGR